MNFSDETVEKVARAIGNSAVGMISADWSNEAKAALSSLTLADLMQVDEVRGLVEAGNNASNGSGNWLKEQKGSE